MSKQTRIELEGGKYTLCHTNGMDLHALRYGERWREFLGDKFVFAMACRTEELEEQLAAAQEKAQ